jgi:two-component system, NtrC family, response regulator HydG
MLSVLPTGYGKRPVCSPEKVPLAGQERAYFRHRRNLSCPIECPAAAMRDVALVEDDAEIRALLRDFLGAKGFNVTEFASVAPVVSHLRNACFDLLITDYHLPDGTGGDVIATAQEFCPSATTVLISGHMAGVPGHVKQAADHVIEKPMIYGPLLKVLNDAGMRATTSSPRTTAA